MSYNSDSSSGGFNIFSRLSRDGKGVERETPVMDNPGIVNFFKLLGCKFNQIVMLNLMMVIGNFPIFFALAVMTGYFSVSSSAPAYTLFAQLNGALMHGGGAFASAVIGSYSLQSPITLLSTTDMIFLGIACLTIFTIGPVSVGATYILRNMVRQEPIFLISDFFYAIRRNLKQSIIYGVLDVIFIGFIAYDIVFFNLNFSSGFAVKVMFFASLCIAVLYMIMRMYIYTMMLTFDLGIVKLLKNALIFSVLGIKRNIVALLGCFAVIALNVLLLAIYYPIGVIVPFIIVFSLMMFITTYAAYPVIHKYMIAPYYDSDGNSRADAESANEE